MSRSPPTVSALVPVHGPLRDAGPELVAALAERVAPGGELLEVLLLCGPAEARDEELRALQGSHPGAVRVLELEHAVGDAGMLRAGADHARGDLLLTAPWPAEVELSVVPEMLARILDGADLAVAVRGGGRTGRSAVLQSRLFNRLLSLAGGTRVRDVASGTRVMRREVVEEIPLYGDFHRYLPILATRFGFRVEEVEAVQAPRARRPPVHKLSTYLSRGIDLITVLFISRFTRTPLRLFGALGSALLAIGGTLLLVIGIERLLGTPLGDRPILVLATLLVGFGVQAFTIGLLGELLLFFHAGQFRDYRVARIHGRGGLREASEPTLIRPAEAAAEPQGSREMRPPRTSGPRAPG